MAAEESLSKLFAGPKRRLLSVPVEEDATDGIDWLPDADWTALDDAPEEEVRRQLSGSYGSNSYGSDSYGSDSYGSDSYGSGGDSYGSGGDSYGSDSYGDSSDGESADADDGDPIPMSLMKGFRMMHDDLEW